jgi:DNA processing protein
MNHQEQDYWLAFTWFFKIGCRRFGILLKYFGSAQKAWQAKAVTWRKLGLPEKLVGEFLAFREEFAFLKAKEILAKHRVSFISGQDETYPKLLKEIPDPPLGLFVKGKFLPQDQKAVAVVGTRKITPYGREVTEKFTAWLVGQGFTVVSGLARGVDSVAHRVALGCGGRTLAVLGCGLDQVYPPEHRGLAEQVAEHGALVSEYPPGMPALPQNFPLRNRIISGLSLGVLVAEGEVKSGTKITAKYAADQGREVFAVPGPITSPTSAGPAQLIKLGAKLVNCGEDILDELKLGELDMKGTMADGQKTQALPPRNFANKLEQQIWETLIQGSKHIDDLAREMKIGSAKLMSLLTLMEVSGKVKSVGSGKYMAV